MGVNDILVNQTASDFFEVETNGLSNLSHDKLEEDSNVITLPNFIDLPFQQPVKALPVKVQKTLTLALASSLRIE